METDMRDPRSLMIALCAVGLLAAAPAAAQEKAAAASAEAKPIGKKKVELTWLGHAAFQVRTASGTTLLIDPFLKGNPKTPAAAKDLSQYQPDAILVTHSHGDHLGDTVEIVKGSKAVVVGDYDMVSGLKVKDDRKLGGNVGGTLKVKDVTIRIVPAMHGSVPGGRPVGYVIELANGRTLYHTGDTWIFGDMALIHELYKPDTLLFNVGGGPYTQAPDVAAKAVKKFFKPKIVVPMHYGTFPPLATEDDVKKAFKKNKKLKVLEIGVPTIL
jgi:L-ascorbate metabolism protein UlaG (beta-lactamase superfamily)